MHRWILLIFFLLTACVPQGPRATTQIEVTLSDSQYNPASWRIPAGEMITLKLSNTGHAEHDWTLLKGPSGSVAEAGIWFQVRVAAGETQTVQFQAPAAPGEYSVICTQADHRTQGLSAKILVVQSGY